MKKLGYTLIELMVVIGIIGVIGAIAIFALNSSSDQQIVDSAARDIVGTMRSLQNKANNGFEGANCFALKYNAGGVSYTINSTTGSTSTVSLPKGVTISPSTFVYFLHPSALVSDCATINNAVNGCSSVSCNINGSTTSPMKLTLTKGNSKKEVYIEFSSTQVGRIYSKDVLPTPTPTP